MFREYSGMNLPGIFPTEYSLLYIHEIFPTESSVGYIHEIFSTEYSVRYIHEIFSTEYSVVYIHEIFLCFSTHKYHLLFQRCEYRASIRCKGILKQKVFMTRFRRMLSQELDMYNIIQFEYWPSGQGVALIVLRSRVRSLLGSLFFISKYVYWNIPGTFNIEYSFGYIL